MDTQSIAGIMERELDRLKAARPQFASRVDRAEHILTVQLSVSNGSRPIKVRLHCDGHHSYTVCSGSKLTRTYHVDPATWGCTCPDYRKRGKVCKHGISCWLLERACA